MAEEVLAIGRRLADETTCPLCLDMLTQPVLTACGHSFCQQCLAGVLATLPRPAACPQCRATLQPDSLRPNRPLGNVAELTRAMGEVAARPRCPRHDRHPELFCEPCAAPLCALCMDEHGGHRVRPAEDAARELRETLQKKMFFLQKQKEKLKVKGDDESDILKVMLLAESQLVSGIFKELQEFLKEQERILLAQHNQLFQEFVKREVKYNSRVSERESLLNAMIAQIKEKQHQPVVEFLMDAGKILSGCEAAKAPILPEPVYPEMQRSLESIIMMRQLVMDTVAKFRENLRCETERKREKVRLDPETACRHLKLSQNCKTLEFRDGKLNLLDTPKRFNNGSVLAFRGFTSGSHYWEVEVGKGNGWAVGVALESVPRKKPLSLTTEKIWALQLDECGQYQTFYMSPILMAFRERVQRIRVHLDYEAGRVTFYNVKSLTEMTQILQFQCTFSEKVFPYFRVWSQETHIHLRD